VKIDAIGEIYFNGDGGSSNPEYGTAIGFD
jgi:hypothetical protein